MRYFLSPVQAWLRLPSSLLFGAVLFISLSASAFWRSNKLLAAGFAVGGALRHYYCYGADCGNSFNALRFFAARHYGNLRCAGRRPCRAHLPFGVYDAAFLLLTPGALLAGRMGLNGLPLLGVLFLIGCLWMLYLLVRSLEAVYLVDAFRAGVTVVFSLFLLYIVFILPWQVCLMLLL